MKYLRRQSGYTLLEVVVATAIFLLAILAVSGLLVQSFKSMGRTGARSVTLHSAQEEIEAVLQGLESGEDVEVVEEPYEMAFGEFGITVPGTLITVKKTTPSGAEIIYVSFVPDEPEDWPE